MQQQNEEMARVKASDVMACESQIKTWENKRREAVAWLIEHGYAGEEILTVGGQYKVSLSAGIQRALDEDKARAILGEIYDAVLSRKQARVTLSLSDLKGLADVEDISKPVETTVKATVKRV